MSEATDIARRALAIFANYPDHVRKRQQAIYLKQLAEHVIRLENELASLDKYRGLKAADEYSKHTDADY